MTVLFLEATGDEPAARRALERARASLAAAPGFAGARLLRARQDPRVLLLAVEWDGPEPDAGGLDPREPGLRWRAWSFERLEP